MASSLAPATNDGSRSRVRATRNARPSPRWSAGSTTQRSRRGRPPGTWTPPPPSCRPSGSPPSRWRTRPSAWRDPQLVHRAHFVELPHGELGTVTIEGPLARFSATPGSPRGPARCSRAHASGVYRDPRLRRRSFRRAARGRRAGVGPGPPGACAISTAAAIVEASGRSGCSGPNENETGADQSVRPRSRTSVLVATRSSRTALRRRWRGRHCRRAAPRRALRRCTRRPTRRSP